MRPQNSATLGIMRRLKLFGLSLVILFSIIGLGLFLEFHTGWLRSKIQSWVQTKVIQKKIEEIQPQLPFQIEKLEIDSLWADLSSGKISGVKIQLKKDDWRLYAEGPLKLATTGTAGLLKILFTPTITLENKSARTTPIIVDMWATTNTSFNTLKGFGISTQSESFSWKPIGLELKNLSINAGWDGSQAKLETTAQSLSVKDQAQWDQLSLSLVSSLQIQPLMVGPKATLQVRGKNLELLLGELYFDLPLEKSPLTALIELESTTEFKPKSIDVRIPQADLKLNFQNFPQGNIVAHWNTRSLSVPETFTRLASIVPKALTDMNFVQGQATTKGRATFSANGNVKAYEGSFRGSRLSFLMKDAAAEVRDAKLSFDFSSKDGVQNGNLEIPKGYFKHFKARLRPTTFALPFHVDKNGKPRVGLEVKNALPLEIQDIPLKFGNIEGYFGSEDFLLKSSMGLDKLPIERLAQGFCFNNPLPPALVSLQFKPIEFSTGTIDPTGQILVDLFGGRLTLDRIGFYDLNHEVHETNFGAQWKGIQLDQLGAWLNFGQMDGVLTGYASNVVFQSWLPTQYDFKFEVIPNKKSDIVFSPDAMKNVIRLFAGEDIDALPGLANWLAFGWPSRVFGGYDIDYFGLSAFSAEGAILVETLDPPKIFEKERQHFILYGPRFKIPLKSARYPLVVDATAMNNFVRHMYQQFDTLKKNGSPENEKDDPDQESETPCLPPGFGGTT